MEKINTDLENRKRKKERETLGDEKEGRKVKRLKDKREREKQRF